MILANLTKAIREQNYYAVVLEFLIVIAGVVIGFQITAWNQERADRNIILNQLKEVQTDIEMDLATLEEMVDAARWRVSASRHLILLAGGEEALPTMSFAGQATNFDTERLPEVSPVMSDSLWALSNQVRGLSARRTGYDSLVGSGNIRLIKDRDLARDIQSYYGLREDTQSGLSDFRQLRAPGIASFQKHGLSVFGDYPVDFVVSIASSDPAILSILRTNYETGLFQLGIIEFAYSEAERLAENLEAALEVES